MTTPENESALLRGQVLSYGSMGKLEYLRQEAILSRISEWNEKMIIFL
jgi:hypothetical protein